MNASSQIGSALGLATIVAFAVDVTYSRLAEGVAPPEAAVEGFQAAFVAGLESHPFRADRLVLIVPAGHRLAGKRQTGFAELLDLDFVGLPRGTALDDHLAMQAARLGRALRLRVRVNSLDSVCAMVAAGVGIGIVPEATALRHRRALPLAMLSLTEAWSIRELALYVRDSRRLPKPASSGANSMRQPRLTASR